MTKPSEWQSGHGNCESCDHVSLPKLAEWDCEYCGCPVYVKNVARRNRAGKIGAIRLIVNKLNHQPHSCEEYRKDLSPGRG